MALILIESSPHKGEIVHCREIPADAIAVVSYHDGLGSWYVEALFKGDHMPACDYPVFPPPDSVGSPSGTKLIEGAELEQLRKELLAG